MASAGFYNAAAGKCDVIIRADSVPARIYRDIAASGNDDVAFSGSKSIVAGIDGKGTVHLYRKVSFSRSNSVITCMYNGNGEASVAGDGTVAPDEDTVFMCGSRNGDTVNTSVSQNNFETTVGMDVVAVIAVLCKFFRGGIPVPSGTG